MESQIRRSLAAGNERMAAWSDLLDRINVFPVADGDTGGNLVVSLAPLRDQECQPGELAERLLFAAKGCSGNIATRFFSGLLSRSEGESLSEGIRRGRTLAWKAVSDPKPGTILSVYDALAEAVGANGDGLDADFVDQTLDRLEQAVLATQHQLSELSDAGVVDSGALAMFIFWDGFLNTWLGREEGFRPIVERFRGALEPKVGFQVQQGIGFCVDAVLRTRGGKGAEAIPGEGESVVTVAEGDFVKVHLHTRNREELRRRLQSVGEVLRFSSDDLQAQTSSFLRPVLHQAIHVMTDAAGSVTRAAAKQLGVTLLDSYLLLGTRCIPETLLPPEELYQALRQGVRVSTAQASAFERHQHYAKVLSLYPAVLYLCVGSVFTGNYRVAMDWKAKHDPDGRLVVIDSEAASGRLGLMALAVARKALQCESAEEVIETARRTVRSAQEYVFLDQLKYLAAGGRLSKTSAFFGDLIRLKPVVSPQPDGARKVGAVHSRDEQLEFAFARMREHYSPKKPGLLMLEYSDNRPWLDEEVVPRMQQQFSGAEILVQPLSLTSGAHMGPGAWALAYLPALD